MHVAAVEWDEEIFFSKFSAFVCFEGAGDEKACVQAFTNDRVDTLAHGKFDDGVGASQESIQVGCGFLKDDPITVICGERFESLFIRAITKDDEADISVRNFSHGVSEKESGFVAFLWDEASSGQKDDFPLEWCLKLQVAGRDEIRLVEKAFLGNAEEGELMTGWSVHKKIPESPCHHTVKPFHQQG